MHILHNWEKWKQYEKVYDFYPKTGDWIIGKIKPIKTYETWQKRICKKCGFIQDRKVK